jgi:tetratricopeptide (TPR) repeat protein
MLKLAESKQDAHLTAKWSAQTEAIAKRLGGQPCARVQAATSHCEQSRELARQVLPYIQYLHFVEILKVKDAEQRLAALEAFLKDCPDSAYEQQARNMIFQIHFHTGDPAKTYQAALTYLKTADDNDDVLLLVAERFFQEGRDPEKTLRHASRALEVAYERKKPDDVDPADFERQKETNIRRAHWLIGRLAADAGNYPVADQHLRAALPALKSDSQLRASALFYLGWANYKMGRMEDALKFNQMCVNIPGVHQDGARRNLEVIQAELKQ